ncbi:MAG: hypothetical protein NC336_07850 [Clostridium sp.]|nr:hypothetical protein [Clostridium sp.]
MPQDVERSSNGYGVAGFIFSVIAVVMSFIKVSTSFMNGWEWIVWGVWCIGAVLSAIGVFRRPRGLAIAGLVIAIVAICVIYIVGEIAAPM